MGKIKRQSVLFVRNNVWDSFEYKNQKIWFAGRINYVKKIVKKIFSNKISNFNNLKNILLQANEPFALAFFYNDFFLCCTDLIRSFPIFFSLKDDTYYFSNVGEKLINPESEIDSSSLLECLSTGYCLGQKTIYKNINCMKPGQLIYNYNLQKDLKFDFFFKFNQTIKKENFHKDFFEEKFSKLFDGIIDNLIKISNDNQIVIPLSGGLDSRLILCKLVEKKYDNIFAFSYGLKKNSDAIIAQKVSNSLNVKWHFIDFNKSKFREYYNSNLKKNYDRFADNLSAVPNYQDVFFVYELKRLNLISDKSTFVNGQTGDFITGAQIPYTFGQKMVQNFFFEKIKTKNFYLWKELESLNAEVHINDHFKNFLKFNEKKLSFEDLFEIWNFEERQVKYIINGQRAYEFFDFRWFLPFWDGELIKFWNSVPFELKYNLNLYKYFLKNWNYQNLFNSDRFEVTAFTGNLNYFVKSLSFLLNFGNLFYKKEDFLMYFDYFSRYGYSYNFFNLKLFIKYRKKIKNAYALHIMKWLLDKGLKNKLFSDDSIRKLVKDEDIIHL